MKLTKVGSFIILCLAILQISCNDDFLNTEPLDKISSDATWADGALSQAFIYNVYSYLGYGGFEEEGLASITDEAMFTHAGRGINVITEATLSPTNLGNTRIVPQWGELYAAIRQANVALDRLPSSTFNDDDLRERLTGEAHFLRAYYYHQLLRTYGGVPLIDRPYELNEDYAVERNTFEETVNFILNDLDMAEALLEGKEETPGRASKLSAMALRSRVLTYAASDLYHAPTAQANSPVLQSYANMELVAFTGGDQMARWEAAKQASKTLLEATSGYMLDLAEPVSPEEGTQNYISIAMGGRSAVGDPAADVELLFQRTHTPEFTQESNWPLGGIHVGINNGPNGYHNWAGNTPIQQLVDDYEMMDGSTFDWDNPEHAEDPYRERDPRFYASIMYDGSDWKPRPSSVEALDPANQIQSGYYDDGNGGIINGVDTRESTIENWNGSRTHYYVRKFIDPDPSLPDNQSSAQVVPWPFIRYTEIALNYAEACIETGEEEEARSWINRIRFRVGMPAVNDAGEALMERYRNERRIELAYEEHRFYDTRRWMIAEETLGRGIKVIDIKATLKPGQSPIVPYRHDKTVYDYTYTPVDNTEVEVRSWDDKMYFMPISRNEVQRNELLIQNPGYE